MKAAKLLKGGKLRVDVLKLPHHGSERNVAADYFETIVAKHYVVSADGKFDNPDVGTLKMISAARPDDDFTIHLTYPLDEFNVAKIGQQVAKFFAAEQEGRTGLQGGDALAGGAGGPGRPRLARRDGGGKSRSGG